MFIIESLPEYSPGTDLENCGRKLISLTFDYIERLIQEQPEWFQVALKYHNISIQQFMQDVESIKDAVQKIWAGKPYDSNVWDEKSELIFYLIYAKIFLLAMKVAGIDVENGKTFFYSWDSSKAFIDSVRKALMGEEK